MMFTLLTCLSLLTLVRPAQEPKPLSFQATLDSIKINARPGQVVTRQVRLTLDPNQRPTHFKAHIDDWWRSEDGKRSFYSAPGTLRRSCSRWTSLNPVESVVRPSETLVVRVTVNVPEELPGGGFWCALTLDEVPDPLSDDDGVNVRFVASVSTGVFVYVEPVQRRASILTLQATDSEIQVKVRNEGNAPLGIEGRVEFVAPGSTTPMAQVVVPRSTLLTEPSLEGVLRAKLPPPTVLPSGRYRVRAILDFGVDHYIGAERELTLAREAQSNGGGR
jgi:hypothetical protein